MREWLFFLIGVALTLLGIWITIRLRPGRRLNVHIATVHLTDKTMSPDPEVALEFRGRRVSGVARHVIYAWNSGNVSIRSSDIATDSPLHVKFSDNSMLSVRDVAKVGQTFQLDSVANESMIDIKFNHLDTAQGFTLEIYEGILDYDLYGDPTFGGHILDSKGIVSGIEPFSVSYLRRSPEMVAISLILLCALVGLIAISWIGLTGSGAVDRPYGYLVAVLGMFLAFFAGQMRTLSRWVVAMRYRVPRFPNLERK